MKIAKRVSGAICLLGALCESVKYKSYQPWLFPGLNLVYNLLLGEQQHDQ